MSKPSRRGRGRPKVDSPKEEIVAVRLDGQELRELDAVVDQLPGLRRATVGRAALLLGVAFLEADPALLRPAFADADARREAVKKFRKK